MTGCGACLGPEAEATPFAFSIANAVRRAPGPLLGIATVVRRFAGVRFNAGRRSGSAHNPNQAEMRRVTHMRRMCSQIARFVAPSRTMRDSFVAFGVAPDKILVSPYGFDRAPFRGIARAPSDRLRLGFIGSVMISKAPHVLLDAVCRLPSGSVSVDVFGAHTGYHGDDLYQPTFDALLVRSGARSHGVIPHAQIPAALASIDVLVVPSIWPENSPLVVGEALLAGVPVVASRIGGIPELIDDGCNGLLFQAGDANDLARALARLLNEPGLLDALRAGAAATPVRWNRTRCRPDAPALPRADIRHRPAAAALGCRRAELSNGRRHGARRQVAARVAAPHRRHRRCRQRQQRVGAG